MNYVIIWIATNCALSSLVELSSQIEMFVENIRFIYLASKRQRANNKNKLLKKLMLAHILRWSGYLNAVTLLKLELNFLF